MVTDLPVPEPPMTTSELALLDGQIDAVQHHFRAEALLDAAQLDLRGIGHLRHFENRTEVRR